MVKEKEKEIKKIEETEEEKQMRSDLDLITKCRTLEQRASEERQKYDWEWLVRQLYVRGYHFARYNRSSNTVIFSFRTGVKIPINLVGAHLRGVRNQVTSFQPKWEVMPTVTTDRAFDNARFSVKVLDWIYEKAQIKRKVKEVVNDALIHSVGIWQFDTDKNDNVIVNRVDPFDFYIDPDCKSPNLNDPEFGSEHVFYVHSLPKDYIMKNDVYKNKGELKSDNVPASAQYKKFLLQVTRGNSTLSSDSNMVLLHEAYLRERDEKGDVKIRVVAYTDTSLRPLRDEVIDDEYPFEICQGDINPGEVYGESWIKHLIPINRVIDALESHIYEYNHLFAKGRFIIDKNSGVRLITNQNGQIIEKNRGSQVQAMAVPPLPSTPFEQIASMRRYLEDISGVHDVSLGRLPGTIRSGIAIAELRQADSSNQSDLVDNLEDFLSRVGRKILRMVAENWTTSKLISVTGIGGKKEYFMAIGEGGKVKKDKFKYGDKELPMAVIGKENDVRVQIGSWLSYTKEARMEKLKELYRLGAIDQITLLQHLEFADIDGISERSRKERILQGKTGSTSQAIEKEYGIQLTDEEVAMAENELMIEGIDQKVHPDDDHELHVMVHKEDADSSDLIKTHIAEHRSMQKWKNSMMSRPSRPEETSTPTPDMLSALMGAGGEAMAGGEAPPAGPTPPETFNMSPVRGAGAPPFTTNQPVIQTK